MRLMSPTHNISNQWWPLSNDDGQLSCQQSQKCHQHPNCHQHNVTNIDLSQRQLSLLISPFEWVQLTSALHKSILKVGVPILQYLFECA